MDLRELKAFVEVVRQGGFSAAAKVLFATQPTVSKAVKQLEDEVGVQLFDRVGHKAKLTVAGDLVYRHAVAMLAERDHLQSDLADLNGLRRGRIRLGLSRLGSSLLFTRLVVQFRKLYPGVEIELMERGVLSLQQGLRDGGLDLAICRLPVPEDLDWILVHDEPLMVLVSREHPLAGASQVDLGQLARLRSSCSNPASRSTPRSSPPARPTATRPGWPPTVASRNSSWPWWPPTWGPPSCPGSSARGSTRPWSACPSRNRSSAGAGPWPGNGTALCRPPPAGSWTWCGRQWLPDQFKPCHSACTFSQAIPDIRAATTPAAMIVCAFMASSSTPQN